MKHEFNSHKKSTSPLTQNFKIMSLWIFLFICVAQLFHLSSMWNHSHLRDCYKFKCEFKFYIRYWWKSWTYKERRLVNSLSYIVSTCEDLLFREIRETWFEGDKHVHLLLADIWERKKWRNGEILWFSYLFSHGVIWE